MPEIPENLDQLAPPPRAPPRPLAARVWLHGALVAGLAGVGLASVGFLYALRHSPLPGEWHLLWQRREAPGWLTGVRRHEHKDRKGALQVSFTYSYVFELPDGRRLSGSSSSGQQLYFAPKRKRLDDLNRPPDMAVEYHPRHLEANRLKGTRSDSGGPFVLFGLVLPALTLGLTAVGLRLAWTEHRLLRHGVLADGFVQQCRLPQQSSGGKVRVSGFSLSWSAPEEGYEPIAEFREGVWGQHKQAVESARQMDRQPVARGCGFALAFVFAFALGGTFGAFALALPTILVVFALGLANDGRGIAAFLIAGGAGWLLGTALVLRWMIRKHPERLSDEHLQERPAQFDRVDCLLTFYLEDGESVGETKRALRLEGDEQDEETPHPLLYDPKKPSRTLLLREVSVPVTVGDDGQWRYARGWPFVRLALVALALPLPAVAWFFI
jgi:hypothetical protein